MEKFADFELIKKDTKSAPVISILIGLGTGTILGIINCSLFMTFFMYIFTIKGEKTSKFESFTMYFMMAIPHNLAHGAPLLDSLQDTQ